VDTGELGDGSGIRLGYGAPGDDAATVERRRQNGRLDGADLQISQGLREIVGPATAPRQESG